MLIDGRFIHLANTGDSRATIYTSASVANREDSEKSFSFYQMSTDHKPDIKEEAERILNAGGKICRYKASSHTEVGPLRVWL